MLKKDGAKKRLFGRILAVTRLIISVTSDVCCSSALSEYIFKISYAL